MIKAWLVDRSLQALLELVFILCSGVAGYLFGTKMIFIETFVVGYSSGGVLRGASQRGPGRCLDLAMCGASHFFSSGLEGWWHNIVNFHCSVRFWTILVSVCAPSDSAERVGLTLVTGVTSRDTPRTKRKSLVHLDLGLARSCHVKLVGCEGRRRPILVHFLLLSIASSFLQVLRLHVFHRNLFCVS